MLPRYFYDQNRRAVITIESPTAEIPTGIIELPGQLELSIMRQIILHGVEQVRAALDLCEDILQ